MKSGSGTISAKPARATARLGGAVRSWKLLILLEKYYRNTIRYIKLVVERAIYTLVG
jgi:hypothetical protein